MKLGTLYIRTLHPSRLRLRSACLFSCDRYWSRIRCLCMDEFIEILRVECTRIWPQIVLSSSSIDPRFQSSCKALAHYSQSITILSIKKEKHFFYSESIYNSNRHLLIFAQLLWRPDAVWFNLCANIAPNEYELVNPPVIRTYVLVTAAFAQKLSKQNTLADKQQGFPGWNNQFRYFKYFLLIA